MSDDWIVLIPEDPKFVPNPAQQSRARDQFASIAPDADDIETRVCDKVEFFDCGANLERILCPTCRSEIPIEWWQDRMAEDFSDGFTLAAYATPCCKALHTLNDLVYDWPQGFGRFVLEAMNPNIGTLDDRHKEELEAILHTRLRVIHQHI